MVRRSGGSGVAISTCACFSRQIVTFSLKNGGVTLRCVSLIPNKLLYMHNTWLAGMDLNWSQQSDMAIYSILVIAFSILKAFCKGHLKKCTQPDCETLILVDLICAIQQSCKNKISETGLLFIKNRNKRKKAVINIPLWENIGLLAMMKHKFRIKQVSFM